ncbi:MAG TPA: prepilin-type N-terminal cleavage/methylation domain-containing protein [Tepidisphaeraceae bacterium]|jgi:prepilin-type N-terminal cleavage/methylation domain-containing protein
MSLTGRQSESAVGGRGFTLIEVMISVFLVLLIIAGINQAFRVVSSTVGAGQALATGTRESFSAQLVFQHEVGEALSHSNDTPFMIIDSRAQRAFLNKQEAEKDLDGNPSTLDLNSNNVEGETAVYGENAPWYVPNNRIHRVDMISFFASDFLRRQTGNDEGALPADIKANELDTKAPGYTAAPGAFASKQTGRQAWIWYGHLWQPTNKVQNAQDLWFVDNANPRNPSYPGIGTVQTNPNNFYATDWTLGRMATLLVPPLREPNIPLYEPMVWGGKQIKSADNVTVYDWAEEEGKNTVQPYKNERPPLPPVDTDTTTGDASGQLLTVIDRPPFIAPPPRDPRDPTKPLSSGTAPRYASYLPIAAENRTRRSASGVYFNYPIDGATLNFNYGDWPGAVSFDKRDGTTGTSTSAYQDYRSPEAGRYDAAIGDFRTFKRILADSIDRALLYNPEPTTPNAPQVLPYPNSNYWRWWESLSYRFKGNPKTNGMKPLDPDKVARQHPVFLRHCTQFIVEFAGDFVSQDNNMYTAVGGAGGTYRANPDYGNVTGVYFNQDTSSDAIKADGVLDYYVDMSQDPNPYLPTQARPDLWVRKIRWYGFPRDIDGDGKILGYTVGSPAFQQPGQGAPSPGRTNNDITDVVPLRDVMLTGYTRNSKGGQWGAEAPDVKIKTEPKDSTGENALLTFAGAPFEKDLETSNNGYGYLPNVASTPTRQNPANGDYATPGILWAQSRYLCAFGPSGSMQNQNGGGPAVYSTNTSLINPSTTPQRQAMVPDDAITRVKMIRITITLDDPNNRLAEGQTFQYIIALQ